MVFGALRTQPFVTVSACGAVDAGNVSVSFGLRVVTFGALRVAPETFAIWSLETAEISHLWRLSKRCGGGERQLEGRSYEAQGRLRDGACAGHPRARVVLMSSSTFSWWRICSAGTCAMAKLFIIETACGTTIVPRTSSSRRARSHQASGSVMPLHGRTRFSSSTSASVHLQRPSRSRVRALGGGGIRTD